MKRYIWFNHATDCYELNKNVTEQYAYAYFYAIENILEEYNIESFDELEKLLKKATNEFEKLERFTNLIINKNVFVNEIKALTLEQYNRDRFNNRLSQEEYNFIKEMIKKYGK